MSTEPTHEWCEMASACLRAASVRAHVRDFKQSCWLQMPLPGMSYYDRLRVADELVASRTIAVSNERLVIVATELPSWLISMINSGESQLDEILNLVDPSGSLIAKFDRTILESIGKNGELFVLKLLRDSLPSELYGRVRHVSEIDDSAGYDILAPSLVDHTRDVKLEVKVMARRSRKFRFFISRNEVKVGLSNDNWFFVAVDFYGNHYSLVGSGRVSIFSDNLPINVSSDARWVSAVVTIFRSQLFESLP